jgi:hypothetical protein
MDSIIIFILDRINRIVRIKSTFGEKKNFRIANISLFICKSSPQRRGERKGKI